MLLWLQQQSWLLLLFCTLCEADKLGFLVLRLEGSCASVEFVTKAFVFGVGEELVVDG